MERNDNTWALVLAAGEGSRLRSLTTTYSGTSIPKQFCSLRGGTSLFHEAMRRGEAVSPPARLCTIVAAQHRGWWQTWLDQLPDGNVIVQPRNLGTAIGILLPLLQIMARDPQARVVLLPADHYVEDEAVLAESMRRAVARAMLHPNEVVLLGLEPDEPDTELGYIVPGYNAGQSVLTIDKFVEKPDRQTARCLMETGALWNAFIVVARASALLNMYLQRYPELVAEMQALISPPRDVAQNAVNLVDLYERLPELDFSRHILQGQESYLRVVAVPHCGWTDLGTPKRVAEALRKTTRHSNNETALAHLNLAAQYARLQRAEQFVA